MTRPELVVVGTSLGGLNALTTLLGTLPARFRVPIVIVQHRTVSPDGGGLAKLLAGQYPAHRVRGGRQDAARSGQHLSRAR